MYLFSSKKTGDRRRQVQEIRGCFSKALSDTDVSMLTLLISAPEKFTAYRVPTDLEFLLREVIAFIESYHQNIGHAYP